MLWSEGFKETSAELASRFFLRACAWCAGGMGAFKDLCQRMEHLVPTALMGKVGSLPAVSAFLASARRARGRGCVPW